MLVLFPMKVLHQRTDQLLLQKMLVGWVGVGKAALVLHNPLHLCGCQQQQVLLMQQPVRQRGQQQHWMLQEPLQLLQRDLLGLVLLLQWVRKDPLLQLVVVAVQRDPLVLVQWLLLLEAHHPGQSGSWTVPWLLWVLLQELQLLLLLLELEVVAVRVAGLWLPGPSIPHQHPENITHNRGVSNIRGLLLV